MDKNEFDVLRKLPDKKITEDIIFKYQKGLGQNLVFEKIEVINSLGISITLNGAYRPEIPSVAFNFVAKEAGGPICRLEINREPHKDSGRNHKHELKKPNDPKKNLPFCYSMNWLEGKTVEEIWK